MIYYELKFKIYELITNFNYIINKLQIIDKKNRFYQRLENINHFKQCFSYLCCYIKLLNISDCSICLVFHITMSVKFSAKHSILTYKLTTNSYKCNKTYMCVLIELIEVIFI